jgi:hypothetical protein
MANIVGNDGMGPKEIGSGKYKPADSLEEFGGK